MASLKKNNEGHETIRGKSLHKKATKEYLKHMERTKLPPLPMGVVSRKGEEQKVQLSERGVGKYYTKAIGKSLSYLYVESFDA